MKIPACIPRFWQQETCCAFLVPSLGLFLTRWISIMPPGTWHVVYTPTPSYVTGGHFYTLESLHLTEFSRVYDHRPEGRFATNAEHDTLRILSRMAIALPVFQASRRMYKFRSV